MNVSLRYATPVLLVTALGCSGGSTSLWVPARQNPRWVRCAACGTMADGHASQGTCDCGIPLPEAAAW